MSEDWLEVDQRVPALPIETEQPADAGVPGLPVSERAVAAAITIQEKRAQLVASWQALTDGQRVFLNTWRECRFNAARTYRVLAGTSHSVSKGTVNKWAENPDFDRVREMLRTASMEEILSRDYLIARQEDIVETLLTPKPVLHQGIATGHFEVEAAAAGKANETLLKLGGHLKDKDIEVNVGVIVGPPTLNIQVMPLPPSRIAKKESVAIDATFTELPSEEDGWLDT